MVNRVVLVMLFLTLLAACGGGGGGGSGIDPRLTRLDIYEAQRLRVLGDPAVGVPGLQVTPDTAFPTAGQVDFRGAASILIERSADNLALAGDVSLSVHFSDRSATGTVTNLFGGGATGGVADFAGALSLSGQVDGGSFPLAYAGRLTTGADSLDFGGTLEATILGNPVSGFAAVDLGAVVGSNGALLPASIVLFGEGSVLSPPQVP